LRAEIRFEHDGGTVRRERPEHSHRSSAHSARELSVARKTVHRDEERFLDVVLGEERKAEKRGERARDGGFARPGRARDQHDEVLARRNHPALLKQESN